MYLILVVVVTHQKKEHTLQSVSSIIHLEVRGQSLTFPTTAGTIRRFLEHYGEDIDVVVFVADAGDVSFIYTCLEPCSIHGDGGCIIHDGLNFDPADGVQPDPTSLFPTYKRRAGMGHAHCS